MRDVIEDAVGRVEMDQHLRIQSVPTVNDSFKTALQVEMTSDHPPDVFQTWGGGILKAYVDAKQVADLTNFVKAADLESRLSPRALAFATIDGKVYAVPMDLSCVVMWYNTKVFEAHGVKVPRTFDELKSVCAKLRKAGVTPIALGNRDKWPGAFYYVYLVTRIGGTKPFELAVNRRAGGSFDAPAFVEAGKRLQELVEVKAFTDGANALSHGEARDLFLNDKAAMMLMGTWLLGEIQGEKPAFLDGIDCFAFPSLDGAGTNVVVGGINTAFAVSSRCRRREDGFALLMMLVSDRTEREWAAKTLRIPALKEDLAVPMLDERTAKAARILYAAPDVQLYYDQALPPGLGELHKDLTQSLIAGTITPEEAARQMEAKAKELAGKARTDQAK
jgi:raffinose/stachyose/melibiose transport system substrate-binding protein